jgi:hypothetical protein
MYPPSESRFLGQLTEISVQLHKSIAFSAATAVLISMISELKTILPLLFASGYPQALTHIDFSLVAVCS